MAVYVGSSSTPSRRASCFVVSIAAGYGIATIDFATGDVRATEVAGDAAALEEIARLAPCELLLDPAVSPALSVAPQPMTLRLEPGLHSASSLDGEGCTSPMGVSAPGAGVVAREALHHLRIADDLQT